MQANVRASFPNVRELIPGRLYWTSLESVPKNMPKGMFGISTDKELVYSRFNQDFGPLDLSQLTMFCVCMRNKLSETEQTNDILVHFSTGNKQVQTNSVCMSLSYLVAVEKLSADAAWSCVSPIASTLDEYVDACMFPHSFRLSVLDVLRGLECAIKLGWYDYSTFDVYKYHRNRREGDFTWIIPNKFIAFSGPIASGVDTDGLPASPPEKYLPHFQDGNVTAVVRLNNSQYNACSFTNAGFRHYDLMFPDGSCPPDMIREKFLKLAETEPVLAVHCKAGLGRTGTLIGLYAMQRYKFPARAFIGWIRLCRPGSILGIQQPYLCDMESIMIPHPGRIVKALPTPNGQEIGQGEQLQRIKAQQTIRHPIVK